MTGKDLLSNWPKWLILLSAIVVAAVLSSKASTINVDSLPQNSVQENTDIKNVTNKVIVPRNGNQPTLVTKPLLYLEASNDETLFLFGEVEDVNSESISQSIISLNKEKSKKPIILVIDSPGGAVFAGSKIISAIEASKRPVYTVCYGICASMAAMVHQYGTKRLMTNRSVLMFHNASGGAQGEVNQMLSQLHFIDKFCAKMDGYIAERAGMNFTEFSNLLNSQIWIDSEDSLNQRFSDQTVSLNLSNIKKEVLTPFTNHLKSHKHLNIEVLKNVSN